MTTPSAPLRPTAESEWPAFVEAYGRSVLDWFRQTGLLPEEARRLAGDFLAGLAPEFSAVAKEPALRFRAWLQFAAHKAWCGLMEGRVEAAGDGANSPALELLLSVESHDAFLRALDVACTLNRRRDILARVRPLVDPPDWLVFEAIVLRERAPTDVAVELGCGELAVRAAAYRVQRALQDEVRAVESAL